MAYPKSTFWNDVKPLPAWADHLRWAKEWAGDRLHDPSYVDRHVRAHLTNAYLYRLHAAGLADTRVTPSNARINSKRLRHTMPRYVLKAKAVRAWRERVAQQLGK